MKSNLDALLEKDSLKIIGIIGMMEVVMTFVILVMTECIIDVSNGKPKFTIKNAEIIKYVFHEAY